MISIEWPFWPENKDISDEICGQVSKKNLQIQNKNDTMSRKNPLF